jgi:hypothetical protein
MAKKGTSAQRPREKSLERSTARKRAGKAKSKKTSPRTKAPVKKKSAHKRKPVEGVVEFADIATPPIGNPIWQRLFDRLMRQRGQDLVRPTMKQMDAALTRYERAIGIPLPNGYKAFIREFGPGEIGGYFRVYGPHISGYEDYGNDIAEENENWRDPEGGWVEFGNPSLVARLIFFSTTVGGDACFWDPEDVRDSQNHEYGTYVHSRSEPMDKVEFVAGTFEDFIHDVCLGHGFDKIGGGWDPAGGPPQRFLPAWKIKRAARTP